VIVHGSSNDIILAVEYLIASSTDVNAVPFLLSIVIYGIVVVVKVLLYLLYGLNAYTKS